LKNVALHGSKETTLFVDKFNGSKKNVNFISAVICRVTWKTIQCIMVRKQIWLKYCVILTHFTVTLRCPNWNTIVLHSEFLTEPSCVIPHIASKLLMWTTASHRAPHCEAFQEFILVVLPNSVSGTW